MRASNIVEWHRKGFGLFWSWKIRRDRPGLSIVPEKVRQLVRTMSHENRLWGAPKIHGEPLKLGIDIGETSVSKYSCAAGESVLEFNDCWLRDT